MLQKLLKRQGLPSGYRFILSSDSTLKTWELSNFFTGAAQKSQPRSSLFKVMYLLSMTFLMATMMSCTYRSTKPEAPAEATAASNLGVEKSFFYNKTADARTIEPKTFLCGWATETGIGSIGEAHLLHNVPLADHCNLIFEITESQLVGKMINPSFPDDPKKWETILTIPITSHYYYEKEKDERGRDKQNYIENSSRSHWSARPLMKLNLAGTQIYKWSYNLFFAEGTGKILSVEDIEWEKSRGFLGFTVAAAGSITGDSNYQGRFRFNFLEFKHNPNFKSTPYNDQNAKYMNILHVMGQKLNGTLQVLKASHWDFSKKQEIYLQGFPKEYEGIGEQVVADWNKALKEVGALKEGQVGFVVNKTQLKHNFDLRYPSMVWVKDERISQNSPLGIALAHADVRNGEILWGGITLYGGFLETYIKAYSSNSNGIGSAGKSVVGSLAAMFSNRIFPKEAGLPEELNKTSGINGNNFSRDMMTNLADSFKAQVVEKKLDKSGLKGQAVDKAVLAQAMAKMSEFNLQPEHMKRIFEDLSQYTSRAGSRRETMPMSRVKSQLFPKYADELNAADAELEKSYGRVNSPDAMRKMIAAKQGGNIACLDRTFAQMGHEWSVAVSQSGRSFDEVMAHVVLELISHEYGHFLGLGHQFKENILPQRGTVPDKYIEPLEKLATEKEGFTNYTSVMGYRSPLVEIAQNEPVVPGVQDKLVLQYLYNQKFATYKTGDSDFTMVDVPASGIIPDVPSENVRTAYFPQCNDMEASYGFDPYCNRFDRGSKASEIVQGYFGNLENLTRNLFAMTDNSKERAESVEGRMWWKSFDNLGRARFFYDYMRFKYKDVINTFRRDEKALFEFSAACQAKTEEDEKNIQSKVLVDIFKKYPEFKDLCQANAFTLGKIKDLVSLKATDFVKMDKDNRYIPGGMTGGEVDSDYSRYDGSWTEMTAIPLKITSLYALTTPVPWVSVGGWNMPILTYADPNMKYAYSSLYPQEYTEIVSANVKSNLKFASIGTDEKTALGQSILSMMFFQYLNQMNNDRFIFPDKYLTQIENQTRFNFSYVAVILDGKEGRKKNDPNRVARFNGVVYDLQTNRTSPVSDVYLLPDAEVIVRAENALVYPVTRLQLLEDQVGYVLAIRVNSDKESDDKLEKISVKSTLTSVYNEVVGACINGVEGKEPNGLSQYFMMNHEAFKGFYMPPGTALVKENTDKFHESITENFKDYWSSSKFAKAPPVEVTCQEALRGAALIVSTAAVLNGYWLGPINNLIQK